MGSLEGERGLCISESMSVGEESKVLGMENGQEKVGQRSRVSGDDGVPDQKH